jgi:hypothetical protein
VGDLRVDPAAITFIKSDTQGHEVHVLRGAGALLQKRQIAWQLEVEPLLMDSAGTSMREFIALLERHFSYFIDLNADAPGRRRRPVTELSEALEYLAVDEGVKTDLIVYAV